MDLQESTKDKPRDQTLEGLNSKPHLVRTYPEGSLAANIIGFVTEEGIGYYGVEEKYNNLLAGLPVNVWVSADPNRAEELPNIPPGATLVLTLDREVQYSVEEILDTAVLNTGAASGTVVVMDPKTGEILALAVTPHMNLNEYWGYKETFPGETPFDRAISQAYEPGSVYKILTMAAALDNGVVKPEDTYFDSGIILIGGVAIRNWNNTVWGQQDMIGCLQHSINACLVHVASLLGNDSFYSYMQKFGIGHTTGIDLAGEATGHLKLPGDSDWYPVDLGTNAFGQGVSVTPIQMVMAASAIANDGKMVYPHLVHAMVQDGRQQNISPQVAGTPISAATAHTLSDMLSISLEKESSNALVAGYRIAGKTGTAQIPTPYGVYDSSATNASFVGWGPLDDPKFLVYVWLEKPQTSIWGSEVAAPVFKHVVEKLVVLMGIPPDSVRLQTTGP
jgi:cell division protein FtsI/penicillin-binding protein 2